MRATTAGCDSTSAGRVLRAFEDTNTSRQELRGAARPGKVKSRSGHCATLARRSRNSPRLRPGLRRSLLLLLEVADLLQRAPVDHVGHRAVPLLGVRTDRGLPPVWAD